MLDTSSWPEKDLGVLKELRLDPANVRLEETDSRVEADIIEDLFVNEGVLELVEGICTIGYLTHEVPIAIEQNGQYIMVEGNRRLAALKAVQNPMLIPEFQSRIEHFLRLLPDRSSLARIRVMIAPGRDEADRLIAAIHTSNLRRRWTPARQAAFFQAQIDSGRQLPELISRYPTINVRRFVFSAQILNLFKAISYESQELNEYLASKPGRKGLSALARVYESREFLDLTGFSMDETGKVTKKISQHQFEQMAATIIQGMAEGNIDTRSLNSIRSPRYVHLMRELRQIASGEPDDSVVPPGTNSPSLTPSDKKKTVPPEQPHHGATSAKLNDSDTVTDAKKADPKKKDPTPPKSGSTPIIRRKKTNLDLSQIKVPETYPDALKLMYGELSSVNVQRFPNTTFLLLRAVLERSIKAFAESKSEDIRRAGNANGKIQLSHALAWLRQDVEKTGPRHLVQVIDGVRSSKVTYNASQDSLNAMNHNHHFMVDPDQVFAAWAQISSIIKHLVKL